MNEVERLTIDTAMRNRENLAKLFSGIGPDYDYSKKGKIDSRGHGSDLGKLPWHPTFSNLSAFNTPHFQGGVWGNAPEGKETFTPSLDMLRSGNTGGLQDYMRRVEGDLGVTLGQTIPVSKEYFDRRTK